VSSLPVARPPGTSLVGKYLLPAERVVIVQRKHWAVLAVPVTLAVGGLLIALTLDTALPASAALVRDIVWLAWTAVLAYLAWCIIEWWADRFVVTNKRVMLVHGILTRKVGMMPLTKVTDMSYERSVLARLLGYGVFVMESAGQDQALSRIAFVPQPDWLYREMCALLFTPEEPGPTTPADGDDGTGGGAGGLGRPGGPRSPGGPGHWSGYGPDDPDPDGPTRPRSPTLPADNAH
jgi:membrane protein YdbS with pleckstrin-like domain